MKLLCFYVRISCHSQEVDTTIIAIKFLLMAVCIQPGLLHLDELGTWYKHAIIVH